MNIFDALKFIRDSDGVRGDYTKVAEALMNLYLREEISSRTLLTMYADIIRNIALTTSPYGSNLKDPQKSQGV